MIIKALQDTRRPHPLLLSRKRERGVVCCARQIVLSAGAALLLASAAAAQTTAKPGAEATLAERDAWRGDTRAALPRTTAPPVIDGHITADEWAQAAEFNAQLSQGWGVNGRHLYPRSVTWYLAWDEQNLYVASRTALLENERPKRSARSGVGSDLMRDDTLEMWLDPKGRNAGKELASYFQSMVNALGITYFARLYPSVGAKTDNWNPGWKIAADVHEGYMDIEIRMPATGFDLARNAPGDAWGIMLARNFMFRNWNQSAMAYEFPNFGFAVNSYYPLMVLRDDAPYVKFHSPISLYRGVAYVDAELHNPGAAACRVKAQLKISDGKVSLYDSAEAVAVPAKGRVAYRVDRPTAPPIDVAKKAVYRYDFTVTAEDGRLEFFHTHFAYDPTENREMLTLKYPPSPSLTAGAKFNPVRSVLESAVDVIDFPRKQDVAAARTVVKDASGKMLAESRTDKTFLFAFNDLVRVPTLTPGKYAWFSSVIMKDGAEVPAGEGTFEKKDEPKEFAWWNFPGGNAEKVLWPFNPVSAENNSRTVKAWGREMDLDGLALPVRIRSTGNSERWPRGRSGNPDVLAGPVRLEATIGGKRLTFQPSGGPKLVSAADHRVCLSGEATAAGLRVMASARLEQDGAYLVELTLAPASPSQSVMVESLDLVIPVRAEAATFLNAYAHCGYSGYFIDFLPTKALSGDSSGRHEVWNSSLCGATAVTVGDFIPQIWLGNEHRGLLWYADNDQGWTPIDGKHGQQIDRAGDQVVLVHHVIHVPTEVRQARTIRFVLQATPLRPLQPGWRMLNTNFAQNFLPWDAMGRSNANYSPMVNLANDAAYAKSLEFSKRYKAHRSEHPNWAMYFAPHTESSAVMTSDWPARNYFGGEWEGGTYTKTLNDHTLWWIEKWIVRGGLQGLYHDQFSPHSIGSVSTGQAYFLPDGRVQPGFALTARRDFVMREHALWLEHGIRPPRTMTHTTNGGPLGSYAWVESCVDGEDKQININTPLDFADTWPSSRIRAGSISYNWGLTMSWMRLIDTKGMAKEQAEHHTRIYAGHCLMHDVTNAWMWNYAFHYDPKSPLLAWGLDDERVVFWPCWNNADVATVTAPDVKVSVWTLPDRVLCCAFNYAKNRPAECDVTLDLKKLGVTLAGTAAACNLEKPTESLKAEVTAGAIKVRLNVNKRDYLLVSLGGGDHK